MTRWLDAGFVDVFRHLHPDAQEYTWWTYRYDAWGRLVEAEDSVGGTRAYAYDPTDRLRAATGPGGDDLRRCKHQLARSVGQC